MMKPRGRDAERADGILDRLRGDAATPDRGAWTRLRRELSARAAGAGLVEVAFERHDSPLGAIVVAATPEGIVRIGLPSEPEDEVLSELARRLSPRVLRSSPKTVERARRQLDEYFAGRRKRFAVPLDWCLTSGFRREVLRATEQIPYGTTRSYREIAREAGRPTAYRAAGTALATNPLPIVVPCHRVLPTGGGLGEYRGGSAAKARLLGLEGAV
jgi:methylated-DNA-[protein]-cysteine S-methyltransferase